MLCACNPSYNPALAELCEKYNDEFKAYPTLYTPKKDPSALENYDTLYSSAQAAADDRISCSFEKALCNEPDTFCCYDLLLRTEFEHRYPISTVSLAKSEEEQADGEFFKQCYDEYTAGADAKTVYDKLIREQRELKKSYE